MVSPRGCTPNALSVTGQLMRRCLVILALGLWVTQASAGEVETIISHEHPTFVPKEATLTVGRDGRAYLHHQRQTIESGYLLHLRPDGSDKAGRPLHYINNGVAARADGAYVVAEAHFAHSATVFDRHGQRLGAFTEFDNSNYDAPQHVEAGASGDFYAADVRAKRVVRLGAAGQRVAVYPVPVWDFRVCEATESFFGNGQCFGFDGESRWKFPANLPFDVDEAGTLHVLQGKLVLRFDEDGEPVGEVALADCPPGIKDLRVHGELLFVRRPHATELFRVHDKAKGALRRVVAIDHDRLRVKFPDQAWTAGESVPLPIQYESSVGAQPRWRVWGRPLRSATYREFEWRDGAVHVPADVAGKYLIKVSPETQPRQGRTVTDYAVRAEVEIQPPARANPPAAAAEMTRAEPAASAAPFRLIQYGDYGFEIPYHKLTPGEAPEVAAFYAERNARLGLNLIAHRLPGGSELPSAFFDVLTAFGQQGIAFMPILLGNDSWVEIGTGSGGVDPRSREQLTADIQRTTKALLPYAAFRGWIWAANWWVQHYGVAAATSDVEKQSFTDALGRAKQRGEWRPVLEEVSDRWLTAAPRATALFRDALHGVATNKVTAVAAPYRNVNAYPPLTFQNVDEVDLHFQAEQMSVPYFAPHNVDFYQRPGKPGWAHPELWNDNGTGDQILPTLFQMVMRGVGGVGFSGGIGWPDVPGVDSRSAVTGTASIYRALFALLRPYGPWLTTLQNRDQVAIVASGRMFRLDEWHNIWGTHFARIKEAYTACLHAHYPAKIVFVEDLQPDTLAQFKAVLLVGQRIELEPALVDALQRARAAGTVVFHDDTCRAELVRDFTPLGIAFNKFEKDKHTWGDDAAYAPFRFPGYVLAHVPALRAKLSAVLPPVAAVDNPEVLLSERSAGNARFLFAVNNTTPDLDPGQLWRYTLFVTSRVPVTTSLRIPAGADAVIYDVFARQRVSADTVADLRSLPMRLYAILPRAIESVTVERTGNSCTVRVPGIDAPLPVLVRCTDATGKLIDEQAGVTAAPIPVPAATANITATELISGRTQVAAGNSPAPDTRFGPHVRDVAILDQLAVFNTMNWDHNLHAIDLATGATRWQQKVADMFAFAPRALAGGVAVEGMDFNTAEGYHLYLADAAGKLERRFAGLGLSRRLPQRFVAAMFLDGKSHFAIPPGAQWVASGGELGLAVWTRAGKLSWQQRDPVTQVAALDNDTLLVLRGLKATAHRAGDGRQLWQTTLGSGGAPQQVRLSHDGTATGILLTPDGGRVYLLKAGQVARVWPVVADEFDLAADGSFIVTVRDTQLALHSVERGLEWVWNGDESLHHPRISTDGEKIAVSSRLGTVTVFDRQGRVVHARDEHALAVPAWLPKGDLLLANWMGRVVRLDPQFNERWQTLLKPGDAAGTTAVPTTRAAGWINAEAKPWPLSPNLLAQPGVTAQLMFRGKFEPVPPTYRDGASAATPPLIDWGQLNWLGEGLSENWLQFDFPAPQAVQAVTIVEDADRPWSWLRELVLEYWDTDAVAWKRGQMLYADAAVHTHRLERPITAARWRLVLPTGLVGNLRLGEVVLHGERTNP